MAAAGGGGRAAASPRRAVLACCFCAALAGPVSPLRQHRARAALLASGVPSPGPAGAPGVAGGPGAGHMGPYIYSYARQQSVNGGLDLKPNFEDGKWDLTFSTGATWDPAAWKWQAGPPGPGPAPVSAGAPPAPAGAPAAPMSSTDALCAQLLEAGKSSHPEQFLDCEVYSYYGKSNNGVAGGSRGCQCSAWTVNCPFETCNARSAWEEGCLAAPAQQLGFTGLSKIAQPLSNGAVPGGFTSHPPVISFCTYWLPSAPHSARIYR